MDDRRFDSLVKSLAEGKSRRSVLKGILGLGGAAIVGGTVFEGDTDAARRPVATPTPTAKCPGQQTWNGSACVCTVPPAPGPNKCGPACCTGKTTDPLPRSPGHTECCDNACCNGTCYGEELCCPTNTRSGGLPPTHIVCDGPTGPVCVPGTCCDDGDCGDPCQRCDLATHTCVARCDEATEVCCTEQAGPVCVTGECCPGAPCDNEAICCQGAESTICCPAGYTCPNGECEPPCLASSVQIFVQTHGPLEVPGVCPPPFENVVTEVGLYPYSNGACADTPIATATTSVNGPAIFPNVPGGQYCALPTDGSIAACLDCPNYGQGVGVNLTVPCSGTFQWTIGVDSCCVDGVSVSIFAGADNGECSQSGTIEGVELGLYNCDTDALLYGPATTGPDGRATFPGVAPGHYCAHATAGSIFSGCEVCPDGGPSFDVSCPSFGGWTVLFGDCEAQLCLPEGQDCPNASGLECCDGLTCCGGQCCSSANCCEGGLVCCGPSCNRCDEADICVEDCRAGLCLCLEGQICDPDTGLCVPDGGCEPNCLCGDGVVDPATDGLDCNGGLAAGGGVCACGWCVVPLDGCPCGCDGDTECIQCVGGECVTYNQGGTCNGGDGVCIGAYCDACLGIGEACVADGQCCTHLCSGAGSCVNCKADGDHCVSGSECCHFGCANNVCYTP